MCEGCTGKEATHRSHVRTPRARAHPPPSTQFAAHRMGWPSACSTTDAGPPGTNLGWRTAGSPRKCGRRRAISRINLYAHAKGRKSAILVNKTTCVRGLVGEQERSERTSRSSSDKVFWRRSIVGWVMCTWPLARGIPAYVSGVACV